MYISFQGHGYLEAQLSSVPGNTDSWEGVTLTGLGGLAQKSLQVCRDIEMGWTRAKGLSIIHFSSCRRQPRLKWQELLPWEFR